MRDASARNWEIEADDRLDDRPVEVIVPAQLWLPEQQEHRTAIGVTVEPSNVIICVCGTLCGSKCQLV